MYDRNNDLIEGAVTYDVFVMQDNDGKVVLFIEGDGGHNDYPLGAEATKYESIIKYLEPESVEKLNSLIDKMGWS